MNVESSHVFAMTSTNMTSCSLLEGEVMVEKKKFYCLRCQHRFEADYERGSVVERSCPNCGSNGVRLETEAAARALAGRE